METVGGIAFLIAGYAWKFWTDTNRSGRVRIGILLGCLICAITGSISIAMYDKANPAKILEYGGATGLLAMLTAFFLGGSLITVTNMIDHDFLKSYGPIRKFFFWYRNITGLIGNACFALIIGAVIVTMLVTNQVSAQEELFNAKQKQLEMAMQEPGSAEAKPAPKTAKHHTHHHHAHK